MAAVVEDSLGSQDVAYADAAANQMSVGQNRRVDGRQVEEGGHMDLAGGHMDPAVGHNPLVAAEVTRRGAAHGKEVDTLQVR